MDRKTSPQSARRIIGDKSLRIRVPGRSGWWTQRGRPTKLTPKQVELARRMHADKQTDIATICQTFGISKSTFHWILSTGKA
ncbi:MAG: helix-turn-helix domain-containing protein [Thermomicrobiales bacterium]